MEKAHGWKYTNRGYHSCPTAAAIETHASPRSGDGKLVAGSHSQCFSDCGLLMYVTGAMSHLHRLRMTDRVFFVSVNLRRRVEPLDEAEYALLISSLEGSRRRLGFLLCGYVLMPDHWHALIWTRHPLTISQVIHDVKKVAARRVHERRDTQGPLWQHQFWDRFVRHEKEFAQRLDYMHYNPVRKGLVKRPEAWRWSSYNNFALDRGVVGQCPIQIDYLRLPLGYRG